MLLVNTFFFLVFGISQVVCVVVYGFECKICTKNLLNSYENISLSLELDCEPLIQPIQQSSMNSLHFVVVFCFAFNDENIIHTIFQSHPPLYLQTHFCERKTLLYHISMLIITIFTIVHHRSLCCANFDI